MLSRLCLSVYGVLLSIFFGGLYEATYAHVSWSSSAKSYADSHIEAAPSLLSLE